MVIVNAAENSVACFPDGSFIFYYILTTILIIYQQLQVGDRAGVPRSVWAHALQVMLNSLRQHLLMHKQVR